MLGGAFGNLIDRIQLGHVTDYLLLSLPVNGQVYSWPAFNVADSCVVVGTILLGIILIFQERKKDEGREPVA
jgi:signal peptidase II